jgi:predicted metal-binding membrane protein
MSILSLETVFSPHHHSSGGIAILSMVIMWQAMTIAMMTPAVLPWMRAFATFTADFPARRIGSFAAGYFLVWLSYSVVMSIFQLALQRSGWLPDGRLGSGIGGVVLLSAGVFQLLPFKNACLSHCRNPMTYFLSQWRNGPRSGFGIGVSHGAFCLGCCWLLMMTGFAMGVMNLGWMAVLTVMIALEQIVPRGDRLARVFGILFVVFGCLLLIGPLLPLPR